MRVTRRWKTTGCARDFSNCRGRIGAQPEQLDIPADIVGAVVAALAAKMK